MRSGDIRGGLSKISTIFGEIRRDSRSSRLISTIFSADLLGFADSGKFLKILATFAVSGNSLHRLEHHSNPKPIQPSDADGQFRVLPSSTRRRRVWSGLGLKPTRPDPWTALTFAMSKHTCVIS